MTRDELIKKVARAIYEKWIEHNKSDATWDELITMNGKDGYQEAKRIYNLSLLEASAAIDTIFDTLKEPTHEMCMAYYNTGLNDSASCDWQAMLNASPLAPKE